MTNALHFWGDFFFAGREEKKSEARQMGKEQDCGARGMAKELTRNAEDPMQPALPLHDSGQATFNLAPCCKNRVSATHLSSHEDIWIRE